jgi:endonuclease G, mitochondrial
VTGRLSGELLEQLVQVIIRNGLDDRAMLLANVSPDVTGSMNVLRDGSARAQLQRDLQYLNRPQGLMDRPDPLESWLINAINSAGQVPDREVFEHVLAGLREPGRQHLRVYRRPFEPGGGAWRVPARQPGYPESVIPADGAVPVHFLAEGQQAAKSVALVSVTRFDQREINDSWMQARGTGWLIGPRMIITALSVVNARLDGEPPASEDDFTEQARNAQVTFDYDQDGLPGRIISVTGVLALSAAYKYAVLQLETDPGVPPLRLAGDGPTDDPGVQRSLNIVRHPLSGPKALAIRNNVTTELSERPDELGYLTATATSPGARGAPVFDDEWRVVAMHQAGEQAAKTAPRAAYAWISVGTKIGAICGDLQSRAPAVWDRIYEGQVSPATSSSAPARVHDSGRFGESITELRKKVNSIAKSYEAGESFWVWDKDQLHDEIYRIQQQLDALCDSLPTAEDDDSGLRQALDRHGSAANRFDEILQQLQVGTSAAQRSAWSSEFKRRGTTWLDDLARLQGALPGAGYRLTGPD